MNILLAVPRLNIGGAETYAYTLALALQQRGFNVILASGGGALAKLLQAKGFKHYFVPFRLSTDLAAYRLKQIIVHEQIDIIHANSAAAGIAAVKTKPRLGIPIIYTAHGVFGHQAKDFILNQCDRIICVSNFVRDVAIERGFSPEKLITVYCGTDLEKFIPDSSATEIARQKLNIPPNAFTLALVSRIKNLHNKGHSHILNILKNHPDTANWHLLIVGKGKGVWQLKYKIWRLGLTNRVHCLGHIVNVEQLLAAADVSILPSNFETFGLVLAEAMAMGKPAVAYATGGTPEVIKHDHTGFLIAKGNQEQFHHHLALLAKDPVLCNQFGLQARAWVEQNFSLPTMVEQLINVYSDIYTKPCHNKPNQKLETNTCSL